MKLLIDAKIHTMNGSNAAADAMAWEDGRIVELGNNGELQKKFPHAEMISVEGKTVVPGFIDPHIHFLQGVLYRKAMDCSAGKVTSIESLKDALAKASENQPETNWIVGQGYDPEAFEEYWEPNRKDLDEICPDHPVVIIHFSFHECVANTRALQLAGIGPETKDPYAGKIQRDKNGDPTGLLIETAMEKVHLLSMEFLFYQKREEILEDFSKSQFDLFAKGITRIGDPGVDNLMIDFYKEADRKKKLHLPVVLHFCSNKQMLNLPWDVAAKKRPDLESPNLISGPLKVFLDGGENAGLMMSVGQYAITTFSIFYRCFRTLSLEPLRSSARKPAGRLGKDRKLHFGTLMARPDDSVRLAQQAVDNKFPLCFHAIGNEAVKQAVETVKSIRSSHTLDAPPRIEHAMFVEPSLISEIKAQEITIVTQPSFLSHMNRDQVPYMPGIKQMPIKTYIDSGIRVSGSSDWPVESFDPILGMHHAVTRETTNDEILEKSEAITPMQALALYTAEPAKALGCSQDVGTLEPGKRADFVVLNSDPVKETFDFKRLKVLQTWVDGQNVYRT